MPYLICYDIRDNKRLTKVRNILINHCYLVQKSVFFCNSELIKHKVISEILKIIQIKTDDLRCYQIDKFNINTII